MSDSDSDYIDIVEDVLENEVENTDRPQRKGKRRGADIEIARFSKSDKYEESEYFKDIQEIFTMRKARDFLCRY